MSEQPLNQTVLNKIRGVSFDLDDTLWDCEPAILRAEAVLKRWLKGHHPEVHARHTVETVKAIRSVLFDTHRHISTDVSLMRKEILRQLIGDYPDSEDVVEAAFAVFYRARSDVELYDGTHELLSGLTSQYQLAAITNGNADLELVGLASYFTDIRRANLDNPPKPEADMFVSCCQSMGIAADELLHVGDNPHTDVLGGHNARVHTVWFNQAHDRWPDDIQRPTFEVHSLAELQQLLLG